jgi:hypothetical protein
MGFMVDESVVRLALEGYRMSDRALLEELINFIDSKSPKWEQQKDTDSIIQIKHKAKEIRTRMAAAQPICKYEYPKYYCELEIYDGDCSHCTEQMSCFNLKKDGN